MKKTYQEALEAAAAILIMKWQLHEKQNWSGDYTEDDWDFERDDLAYYIAAAYGLDNPYFVGHEINKLVAPEIWGCTIED